SFDQIKHIHTETSLRNNIKLNPGAAWQIGNEPDGILNWVSMRADVYAELYHYYYTIIKDEDPSAKVVIGAIIQPTPLRMQYLDAVLDYYETTYQEPMPIDIWNIHFYRLPEQDCSGADSPPFIPGPGLDIEFIGQDMFNVAELESSLRNFRQWMKSNGYQNKPLIITEYGSLMPSDFPGMSDPEVRQFLWDMSEVLFNAKDVNTGYPADDHRLVQLWAWFATRHDLFGGDLFDEDDNLTIVGEAFVDEVESNFTAYSDLQLIPPLSSITDTDELNVSLYMQNRGNVSHADAQVHITLADATNPDQILVGKLVDLGQIERRYNSPPTLIESTFSVTYSQAPTMTVPYVLEVSVTPSDVNSNNDTITQEIQWWPLTDLAVNPLSLSLPTAFAFKEATSITVETTVTNLSEQSSSQTPLDFTLTGPGPGNLQLHIATSVSPLMPSASQILSATFVITQGGVWQAIATLGAPSGLGVDSVENNQQSLTFLAALHQVYLPVVMKN
ncbi:MAG: hypothetical protein AAF629_18305, partial [Chloroflexota bacterium]